MKGLSVKARRILAAVGGAAIVLVLLLAADAVVGDPVSRALARHSAVAFAEKLYPGQTFAPAGETLYSQPFGYDTQVQSVQSPDTSFWVRTRAWLFTGDAGLDGLQPSHIWYVEQKRNTCLRLEREAGEQLAALAQEKYGDAFAPYSESGYRPFVFMLCCDPPDGSNGSQNVEAWGDALTLDEPFAPAVLEKTPTLLTACRICPDDSVTAAEETKALQELKAFVEGEGWHADYYQIRFLCQSEGSDRTVEFAASDAVPAGDIKALSPA